MLNLFFHAAMLWVTLTLVACSTLMPKMAEPITLYKGCPEVNGICKNAKPEVKAAAITTLSSLPEKEVSEWIDQNINGKALKVLPANSKEFSQYQCLTTKHVGVLLNFINDLKRALAP